MARIDERNPEGVDGEWFIDERCIGCGSSASVAPELIIRSGAKYVFQRQPDGEDELDRAWLARELCPTRSIGTETRTAKRDPYPHEEAPGVYRCGHNDRASFGAHSFFLTRPDGNLLVDSPRHTFKLAGPFEDMGGLAQILLTHRDDVADAEKWAEKFGAAVTIHRAEQRAAPFATRFLTEPVTEIAEGVQAVAVPGHTEGSVVYLVDQTYLFTGDSVAWSHSRQDLYAFRDATWYSWKELTTSLRTLADFRFEQIFAGHGASSPRLDAAEMRSRLLALADRMAADPN